MLRPIVTYEKYRSDHGNLKNHVEDNFILKRDEAKAKVEEE